MKEELTMLTLAIIAIALISLVIAAVLAVVLGGAGIILVFGDLLVCALIIGLIVRAIIRRN